MLISTWTIVLALISLVTNTISKSISILDKNSIPLVAPPVDTITYKIEALKEKMRGHAQTHPNIYNSLSKLNVTLEEKRRLLRQYREKLQELNELDNTKEKEEPIYRRDIHSYKSIEKGAESGYYTFPVNIAQPTDYTKETKVQSATLSLHRRQNLLLAQSTEKELASKDLNTLPNRNVGYNTVLLVYQTLPGGLRRLVTSKVISLAQSGWIKIDVTDIVQSWVTEPGMNKGIEIECTTQNISQILTPTSIDSITLPSLNVVTYEKSISVKRRQRRDINSQEVCSPGGCCRKPVNIRAADVGLPDHLFDGEYIRAYICTGGCPNNHKLHTFWARVKDTLSLEKRCAPVEYDKLFYIYHDTQTDEVAVTEYEEFIVSKCACV